MVFYPIDNSLIFVEKSMFSDRDLLSGWTGTMARTIQFGARVIRPRSGVLATENLLRTGFVEQFSETDKLELVSFKVSRSRESLRTACRVLCVGMLSMLRRIVHASEFVGEILLGMMSRGLQPQLRLRDLVSLCDTGPDPKSDCCAAGRSCARA
jgi:hypothetical protein